MSTPWLQSGGNYPTFSLQWGNERSNTAKCRAWLFFNPFALSSVWLLLRPGETQGQGCVDKTLRVLTFQLFCPFLLLLLFFFFHLLLPFWPQCFLEAAQMMGWCSSGICGALALLALLLPLRQRGCWGLEPSSGDLEKSPHSDPDPWEVLHRDKRSWVWNQFFVLEEFTGNEPLYVGKVSDLCSC